MSGLTDMWKEWTLFQGTGKPSEDFKHLLAESGLVTSPHTQDSHQQTDSTDQAQRHHVMHPPPRSPNLGFPSPHLEMKSPSPKPAWCTSHHTLRSTQAL